MDFKGLFCCFVFWSPFPFSSPEVYKREQKCLWGTGCTVILQQTSRWGETYPKIHPASQSSRRQYASTCVSHTSSSLFLRLLNVSLIFCLLFFSWLLSFQGSVISSPNCWERPFCIRSRHDRVTMVYPSRKARVICWCWITPWYYSFKVLRGF